MKTVGTRLNEMAYNMAVLMRYFDLETKGNRKPRKDKNK